MATAAHLRPAGRPRRTTPARRFALLRGGLGWLLLAAGFAPPAASVARAAGFSPADSSPSPAPSGRAVRVDASLAAFASALPVIVLDSRAAWCDVLPPATGGVPTFASRPLLSTAATAVIDPAGSAAAPKASYRVALRDNQGRGQPLPLLGLATDDTWALVAPANSDRAFIRSAYVYSLSNSLGRWAPHTKFVELFYHDSDGPLGAADYAGVSVLTERIAPDAAHLNLAALDADDTALPAVTGGYILRIDAPGPDRTAIGTARSASWFPPAAISIVQPAAAALAQRDYIRSYLQAMETALYADYISGWATHGYLSYLDRASWVDYHLLQVFSGNADALARNFFFTKNRNGKLVAGPPWGFDHALGSADDRSPNWNAWNTGASATDVWHYGWWDALTRDPEFQQAWIDRWFQLRRTSLADEQLAALADALAAQVGPAAAARDAARWPDDAGRDGGGWPGEISRLKNWAASRAGWIDRQFIAPPTLETDGTLLVATPPAGAQLAYTLNGTDPRGPNGQLGLGTQLTAAPLVVSAGALLVARAYQPAAAVFPATPWSAPLAAADATPLGAGAASPLFASRLSNHSSLVHAGPADPAPITGFVVGGAGERQLLLRAVGPALAAFGVTDALPDPVFVVRRADGAEIQRVAGWTADPMLPQLFASVGAFALPDGSGDAACAIRLQPGAYMVEIASASGRSGTALAEIYDLQQGSGLVSLATRGVVNATFRPLLGGFTVQGTMSRKLLVRAAGPALAAFGLTSTLADPVLTVFAGAKSVAQNDDWSSSADDVAGAAAASGAFKFPDGSRDAALVLTLAPGAYTAQVTGKPGDAGLALLEIYAVP